MIFHITLPKLLNFEFRGEGPHKNFSNWMSWEKVFQHGSVALRNSKGTSNATDMEAIIALCLQAASGMLFRIVIAHVHHPCFKPSLKEKNNSIVIPYARIEKPKNKLCSGHLPVVEILSSGEDEVLLPESAALKE